MTVRFVFHAGMSKAGSTSIQRWIARNVELLQAIGIRPMRIVQAPNGTISLVPATSQGAASVQDPLPAGLADWSRPAVMERICDALDQSAPRDGVVVVSGESYESDFHHADAATLAVLDAFARTHDMRVAYYVRPQHTWLRSAWQQWGFRVGLAPDAWVRWNRRRINYLGTLTAVKEGAPHLRFEIRPCRTDLLAGGSVVADFARAFLNLRDLSGFAPELLMNPSVPLVVSILLRDAPPGMFWTDDHDHRTLDRLREIVSAWEIPEADIEVKSQQVLQHYAHELYEPGNQLVIETLGWPTDYFIPPLEPTVSPGELHLLNEYWQTTCSSGERHVIYIALKHLLGAATRTDAG